MVPYWSNHCGSEGVTLMKYSVIVGCIFWGKCIHSSSICKFGCKDVSGCIPLTCQEFVVQCTRKMFALIISQKVEEGPDIRK